MVEEYIYNLHDDQKKIAIHIHNWLIDRGLNSKIRYKVPFYDIKSWICYINPKPQNGIELCFLRANELGDSMELLEFKNRKQVAGMIFYSLKDFKLSSMDYVLQQAILLDETVPYSVKKSK